MGRLEFFKPMLHPGSGGWASREIAQEGEVAVSESDLAEMLRATIDGLLTPNELRDWANLVLFNDAFDFDGERLRDTLDRIEESDEPGRELSISDLLDMLKALGQS
ncbi:MAG: hypothetical protein J6D54_00960 [Olsenella sp.]|nr:hypothetical protein [Olsenella sp.]